ncbi:MAG: translation initiation factor IF-3 [Deltaproteobacteria bacterium]|nr:MAG: translation initiation factor IF-3 [Deltaproteobacteria bacterium]TMQ11587.1 MAG: translation initiation factor IF-3 [Deltaproteobacteria bacterium]
MNGRPPGRFDRRRPEQGLRINHRIRVPEIRVILEEEQLGIMPTHEALRLAEEKGLDLVEISPRAFPPVCRIMDYGKYKYEEAKKKQQQKKKASTVETKEIKFRPKTEEHDMDFKVKHIRRFLESGDKVRLAVVFRGREITHPQTGMKVLNRVVELCSDIATVESTPNMEGRRMIMVIAPKPGVVRKAQEARKAAAAAAQLAAVAQKKEPPGGKRPPEPEDEDLDEADINADVDEDDDEDEAEVAKA